MRKTGKTIKNIKSGNERYPVIKAAVVVIGNEILSGRTQEKNVMFIAEKLVDAGIQIGHVRIVPDIEDEIVNAVNELRNKYTYVFTTGGIGPTHDDVTSAAISKAFGRKIVRNRDALHRLEAHYRKMDLNEARKSMADMPSGIDGLIDNSISAAPGFIIENVYVLAGIPEIMQAMMESVVPKLKGGAKISSKTITCSIYEGDIAAPLAEIQKKYTGVDIGSYPSFCIGSMGLSIVIRSYDEVSLQRAAKDVKQLIEKLEKKSKNI